MSLVRRPVDVFVEYVLSVPPTCPPHVKIMRLNNEINESLQITKV